jgi:hypothetical protein
VDALIDHLADAPRNSANDRETCGVDPPQIEAAFVEFKSLKERLSKLPNGD